MSEISPNLALWITQLPLFRAMARLGGAGKVSRSRLASCPRLGDTVRRWPDLPRRAGMVPLEWWYMVHSTSRPPPTSQLVVLEHNLPRKTSTVWISTISVGESPTNLWNYIFETQIQFNTPGHVTICHLLIHVTNIFGEDLDLALACSHAHGMGTKSS